MKDCDNVDAFQVKLAEKGLNYAFVGDSDSSLITMDIGKFYPNAPVLVVKRDPHEAADSLIDLLGVEPGKALDIALDRKQQIKDAVRHCNNVAEVDYEHINDKLEYIWKHCIGDGFDRSRAEHLIEMNIQKGEF